MFSVCFVLFFPIGGTAVSTSYFFSSSFCSDKKELYMGDDNALTLTFSAWNGGGGAYEAELFVVLPSEADYSGIARNNEVIWSVLNLGNLLCLSMFDPQSQVCCTSVCAVCHFWAWFSWLA